MLDGYATVNGLHVLLGLPRQFTIKLVLDCPTDKGEPDKYRPQPGMEELGHPWTERPLLMTY